ncbi:MAG: Gfo/Idh/MocA family oxidoreductase [Planctomycetaceae bacterium]
MNQQQTEMNAASRRQFLKQGAGAMALGALAASMPGAARAYADGDEILRIGLVGCGGRGTGAAENALTADKNTKLVAMGDVFPERIESSLGSLARNKGVADRIAVDEEHRFVGFDAYQKVIDSCDVVLLCTPPGFRPPHFKAAVEAGKHIFIEKPMATDFDGVKSVMETVRLSKTKPISVLAGFCWRYDIPRAEMFKRVLNGDIGDVLSVLGTYLTGPVRPMQAASRRGENVTDLEWMLRNWYNFTWISGDGLVEQACHTVDWIAWAKGDTPPASCSAVGGRQIPSEGGDIFDHVQVDYVWPDGTRASISQRQITGCYGENNCYILGSKGQANIARGVYITGENAWRYEGNTPSMYQLEHDFLFQHIRRGDVVNDGDRMVQSTLMAIMGRTAGYTGKQITWEQALAATEKLVPEINDGWNSPVEFRSVPRPGVTKFV